MAKNNTLEIALINLFRNGNVTNMSQTAAQITCDPSFRNITTEQVRNTVLRLEREGVLKRDVEEGITRFMWAKSTRKATVNK